MAALNFVIEVSPVVLPPELGLRREPPRPPGQREATYEDNFDYLTLYYDAFVSGGDLRLVGPPLLDLERAFREGLHEGGRRLRLRTERLDRSQRTVVLNHDRRSRTIGFRCGTFSGSSRIGTDLASVFNGRRALLTVSKDNRLDWVRDWARFYALAHGVDAVIVYDNGSVSYSCVDLLAALGEVPGLEVAVVVNWPFKYGPMRPDGPWDSDYCQYGALEHARWRMLRGADGVINADIDELVVTKSGTSVFGPVRRLRRGYLLYRGTWVDAVPNPDEAKSAYSNFAFANSSFPQTSSKWCLVPARVPARSQWRVHDVAGAPARSSDDVTFKHFHGITNRRRHIDAKEVFDPEVHALDTELQEALTRVGM